MVAYQAKLLEMTQANMQFAFDFSQRLATIRSPFRPRPFSHSEWIVQYCIGCGNARNRRPELTLY
jgi:hypothetical protein